MRRHQKALANFARELCYVATPIFWGSEAHSPRRHLLAVGCRELALDALPSSSIEEHFVLPPHCYRIQSLSFSSTY